MPTAIWIILGIVILGALLGGKGRNTRSSGRPHRIDHPHVIDPDEYECSVCHRRFRERRIMCPHCGARFGGIVVDREEYDDEEDELEDWDEEDGL